MTDNKYIPSIDTSGYFNLKTPFDTQVAPRERYTLKSVRLISDFVGNNEDIKTDVYTANGIQADYEADAADDIEILGLQSERGHWIKVPVTYVLSYPDYNGIPYRAVNIVLPLQPIPADTDLSDLLSQLEQVVVNVLGLSSVNGKVTESSRTIQVTSEKHITIETDRALRKAESTPAAQIAQLTQALATANDKVTALENYIVAHP